MVLANGPRPPSFSFSSLPFIATAVKDPSAVSTRWWPVFLVGLFLLLLLLLLLLRPFVEGLLLLLVVVVVVVVVTPGVEGLRGDLRRGEEEE